MDKRGKRIEKTLAHKLKAGDKLLWAIKQNEVEKITLRLSSLDEAHQTMAMERIFKVLDCGAS